MRFYHAGLLLLLLCVLSRPATANSIAIAPLAPGGTPKALACEYLKRLLVERSGGRLQVVIIDRRFSAEEALNDLRANRLQLALAEIREIRRQLPLLEVLETPYLFQDRKHLYRVLDGEIGQQLLEQAQRDQIRPLAIWEGPTRQLLSHKALPEPEIDARALFMPPPAGAKSPAEDWEETDLQQCLEGSDKHQGKTVTLTAHNIAGSAILAAETFWEDLPEDLRVIFSGALKDATDYARELAIQADREALDMLNNNPSPQRYSLTDSQRKQWQKKFRDLYSEELDQVKLYFTDMIIRDSSTEAVTQ